MSVISADNPDTLGPTVRIKVAQKQTQTKNASGVVGRATRRVTAGRSRKRCRETAKGGRLGPRAPSQIRAMGQGEHAHRGISHGIGGPSTS
ncbi:Uncharacterised protein [Chlamydia abortus]|nr:Uncharacterised protein [Chlamydia abortus]